MSGVDSADARHVVGQLSRRFDLCVPVVLASLGPMAAAVEHEPAI